MFFNIKIVNIKGQNIKIIQINQISNKLSWGILFISIFLNFSEKVNAISIGISGEEIDCILVESMPGISCDISGTYDGFMISGINGQIPVITALDRQGVDTITLTNVIIEATQDNANSTIMFT